MEQRLDLNIGKINFFLRDRRRRRGLGGGSGLLLCLLVRVKRLHCREQQHVPDGGGIGQQHHQPIYTEAQTACGGQSVFQSGDVIVIYLGLAVRVQRLSLGHLTLEAALLVDGVVQLGEGVAELRGVDEILKPLSEGGIVGLPLGQGAVLHWVIVNKGGLDEVFFHKCVEELRQNGALGGNFRQFNVLFLGDGDGLLIGGNGGEVHAGILLHGFDHGHSLPVAQVDVLALVVNLQSAADVHGHGLHHVLHQVHHAVKIGVGLIQLDGSEFRVVGGVHAFVPEDAAHLVDSVHAAHDQPLQVQLRLDTQHHVDVQGVVMGVEGARGSADLKGGQDGGVHLQEAPAIQKMPQLPQDLAPLHEGVLDLRVHDEVNITLTIPGLPVGKTVELLRQGQQGLGKQGGLMDPDGNFAPLGPEHVALDAHNVANVVLLETVEGILLHLVDLHIKLDAAGVILQVAENHLAHAPLAHEPSAQGYGLAFHLLEMVLDLGGGGGHVKLGLDEGVQALAAEVVQLLPADLHLVAEGQLLLGYKLRHSLTPLWSHGAPAW